MTRIRTINKFSILAWLYNLALLFLSLAPIDDQIPKPLERSDLIYHGLAYSFAALFFIRAYPNKKRWVVFFLISQGIMIEFLQPYFRRHFEFLDMVANACGVIIALVFIQSFKTFSSSKSTDPSK